jgi:isoleucyl-tRNA synthetase
MGTFDSKQDFVKVEHEILKFWDENRIFEKLREKNRDHKPFRFLDGPITANNPMGIHHAWGRTIKDSVIRYKAMKGYSCHYRNGFDTQGLWVEVEVEKELGFRDKKDIENYGTDNFTKKCVERINKFSKIITEQSKRLGQWMDWDNSYYTHTDENISGIWSFLKKCHNNGWIIQAHRPMPWCPRCGTSLSEHEMSGSYKDTMHTAVFVRLPVQEKEWDILVWTTTPWTLTANVALAVNPEIEYCVVKGENNNKPMLLAKSALKQLKAKSEVLNEILKYEILYTLKGVELEGLVYETCFPNLQVQKSINHKVVLWDMVTADEGSGVVHIAPGCGAEDYQLGQSLDLPAICPIDELGTFMEGYDCFTGIKASEAAPLVFSKLEESGKLYKIHKYKHSYPVCWRCKTEVLFRLVREWYIKTDEIKPRLVEAASKVSWEPEFIGKRMQDWLNNMGDWNISRKRYYGLPLPFYHCENCGRLTVIGSKDELIELGGKKAESLPELHRPWIDEITITCPQCGNKVSRVAEVGDVWLDAGVVPFTTLGYFKDKEKWRTYYPAEWVTEMREQVRLWFYSLLFMSVTFEGRAPYERVLAYSSVIAEDGTKFSKTGFMIKFDEAAEKLGADTIRYMFAGANVAADVRFGYNLGEEARRKLLSFWNIYVFFMTYAVLEKPELDMSILPDSLEITDRWLLARTDEFLNNVTAYMDSYKTAEVVKEFEIYVDDVSNWYVRSNRRRFWKQEKSENKHAAYWCLYKALKVMLQVMAPIIPFMTEYMWQSMVRVFDGTSEESVHLSNWPEPMKKIYTESILKDTEIVRKVIGMALKLRNEKQIKVKQPLPCIYVVTASDNEAAIKIMTDIIKDELNIKEIVILKDSNNLNTVYLTLNFKKAGSVLKDKAQALKSRLDTATEDEMAELVKQYQTDEKVIVPGWIDELPRDFFIENKRCKETIAVAADKDITVALDTKLTEDLIAEGLYRELLRQCQLLRKEAGLQVDQRILLVIKSDHEVINEVTKRYADNIAGETLALKLVNKVDNLIAAKEVIVGDYTVLLQVGI